MRSSESTTPYLTSSLKEQHVLLLGASGASGLAFIRYHQTLSPTCQPYLTVYIRTSARVKLTTVLTDAKISDTPGSRVRIIEGTLTDKAAIVRAVSPDEHFTKVTVVICVLGAYRNLRHFILRTKPTPITDALNSTIIPSIREQHIKRILVLSTNAFPYDRTERSDMSWGVWLMSRIPAIALPQANAEMIGIASSVMFDPVKDNRTGSKFDLEATVFRVPLLGDTEGSEGLEVIAGRLDSEYRGSRNLTRESLVRWLTEEIERKEWIGKSPELGNLI